MTKRIGKFIDSIPTSYLFVAFNICLVILWACYILSYFYPLR